MTSDSPDAESPPAPVPVRSLRILVVVYCVVLLLALDVAYSNLLARPDEEKPSRVPHPRYHHDFAPSYQGYERWGHRRYRLFTNDLGFKDASPRAVARVTSAYRIILMGDSFTEAIGVPFEESFAGLLYQAGQRRVPPIEFLNAGVSGYSPTVYLAKIKHLLEAGVRFDEVVVLLDAGDVVREATSYFCLDEDSTYRSHCAAPPGPPPVPVQSGPRPDTLRRRIERHLVVTSATWSLLQHRAREWRRWWTNPSMLAGVLVQSRSTGWPVRSIGVGLQLPPIGLDGGIVRAQRNMQSLADHLRAQGVRLTVTLHPWPAQLAYDDRQSRQLEIWRAFSRANGLTFIDLSGPFFDFKSAHPDWYERLFIFGDVHYSALGNELMFRELAPHLLHRPGPHAGRAVSAP
jgi:hypothetical protein